MPNFLPFALRDAVLVIATIGGWLLWGELSRGQGAFADIAGVMLGLMAGACAWQAHEWGHLLSAALFKSKVRAPGSLWNVYLFGFDNKANKRHQFIAMALGGFAATAIVYFGLLPLLPDAWLATRVLHGLVLMEIALTLILEVPGLILGIFAYSKLPSVDVLPQEG